MTLGTRSNPGARFALACLLVTGLAAATLLPGLRRTELRVEEGRRAWTARTMLAEEDFVVPRIWGRPYLSKPPLFPWTIAALSAPGGRVTPLTTRLAAVLPSLLLGLALLGFAWRRAGPRTALLATLLLLGSSLFVEKGRLGEIEALLSLGCFLSIAALGVALEGRRVALWTIGSGLALGAGLLAKGPPALVFFLGAAAGLWATSPDERGPLLRAAGAALAIGLSFLGAWAAALLAALPSGSTLAHWANELVGQGERGLLGYLKERPEYALASVLGMAPASLVLFVSFERRPTAAVRPELWRRLAGGAIVPAWLWFLLYPGTSARYVFPILPWVALLAAARLGELRRAAPDSPPVRRTRGMLRVFAALLAAASLGALATLVPALRAAGLDPLRLGADSLSPWAPAAALGGLALALLAIRELRGAATIDRGGACLALAGLALLTFSQEASDLRRSRRHQSHLAQRIEAHLPAGAPLHVALWGEFNLLFLLERELIHVEDPRATPPGGFVLLPPERAKTLLAADAPAFDPILTLEGPRSGPLALLRARPAER